MNNDILVNKVLEAGHELTENVQEAIFLLSDGRMISGEFDYGARGVDHRMIECAVDFDRYDPNFWSKIHHLFNLVMMVPEAKLALIQENQKLTPAQKEKIKEAGYEVEVYCKDLHLSQAFEDRKLLTKELVSRSRSEDLSR